MNPRERALLKLVLFLSLEIEEMKAGEDEPFETIVERALSLPRRVFPDVPFSWEERLVDDGQPESEPTPKPRKSAGRTWVVMTSETHTDFEIAVMNMIADAHMIASVSLARHLHDELDTDLIARNIADKMQRQFPGTEAEIVISSKEPKRRQRKKIPQLPPKRSR